MMKWRYLDEADWRVCMLILYFSGTGNSKYVAELFAHNTSAACHSIEEGAEFVSLIADSDTIAFCYPVYMSRVPRVMREFAVQHMNALKAKKIIIFCTQFLLSGDGARAFAALFPKGHVSVIYAEHFFMPNNVNNVAILPIANDKAVKKCMVKAEHKMHKVCDDIKNGKVKRRGFNPLGRLLGLPQGVFMSATERLANKSIRINDDCTDYGISVKNCPTKNLISIDGKITHNHNCTMCYHCINKCPKKSINVVFRGKVRKQYEGINH